MLPLPPKNLLPHLPRQHYIQLFPPPQCPHHRAGCTAAQVECHVHFISPPPPIKWCLPHLKNVSPPHTSEVECQPLFQQIRSGGELGAQTPVFSFHFGKGGRLGQLEQGLLGPGHLGSLPALGHGSGRLQPRAVWEERL